MANEGHEAERQRIDYELKGKTMKVYLYLLKHGRASGISEVQRALGFSSPSIAVHHLDKLVGLGIVEKNERSEYVLAKKVDVGVLSAFVQVGGFVLPRMGFYASFFTALTILYIVEYVRVLNPFALVLGSGSSAVLWYESFRLWRSRPR
jgi:DNA-binding transcriptional ArsR family regulator